ncbi:DNA-processing protein DprA [Falsirhodobacter halotolerans]|uniref:DNA-processing protein DprA n=1 Tax=Falsirhodobacter halotolerans TaxID=1146892 RepID=UPI001FD15AC4|nr:DNA-processing protein DprA [Falsirhodobacter halotolerans]MCJ8138857.1 DNA-processing protein DprA [Falsirhodobacter halotolerans]
MDDIHDTLRLIRSRRVGAVTFHRLVEEHGSARAALRALPDLARASGVEAYETCPPGVVEAELRQGAAAGAVAIGWGDPRYPPALAALPDAPPVLWAMGRVDLLARPAIALVGARNASSLGVRMARTLAFGLADAGHVVVSGLARGIDTAAHASALEGGTVAVMAGGIDVIYPAENTGLATSIAIKGCLLTEQPPGTEPQARHFPLRNRIVSGLSRGVVVVEAAARSGSLITAKMALEQGREVYAVPGHPFDARAAGCNQLIRDGATLVTRVADVLDGVGTVRPTPVRPVVAARRSAPPPAPALPPAAPAPTLLDLLGPAPVAEDQLIRDLGRPPADVAAEILMLELDGRVERQAGGMLVRVPD